MKRVPPLIGVAILEKEDIQKMSQNDLIKLAFVYGAVWGFTTGMVVTVALQYAGSVG